MFPGQAADPGRAVRQVAGSRGVVEALQVVSGAEDGGHAAAAVGAVAGSLVAVARGRVVAAVAAQQQRGLRGGLGTTEAEQRGQGEQRPHGDTCAGGGVSVAADSDMMKTDD